MKNLDLGKISSLSDFIEIVCANKQIFGENSKIWFRGESQFHVDTFLTPGLFRSLNDKKVDRTISYGTAMYLFTNRTSIKTALKEIKDFEGNVHAEFSLLGDVYMKSNRIKNNRINTYFLMQHYGVKTRLLDWSTNALYALFFAVQNTNISQDGVVWLLEPFELNNFTTKKILKGHKNEDSPYKHIPNVGNQKLVTQNLFNKKNKIRLEEIVRRYFLLDFPTKKYNSLPEYYPYAIRPGQLDPRFINQESCFTIFGNVPDPFSDSETNVFIKKIIIDGSQKSKILEDLDSIGINVSTIYPTLDNLGTYLNRKLQIPQTGEFIK